MKVRVCEDQKTRAMMLHGHILLRGSLRSPHVHLLTPQSFRFVSFRFLLLAFSLVGSRDTLHVAFHSLPALPFPFAASFDPADVPRAARLRDQLRINNRPATDAFVRRQPPASVRDRPARPAGPAIPLPRGSRDRPQGRGLLFEHFELFLSHERVYEDVVDCFGDGFEKGGC